MREFVGLSPEESVPIPSQGKDKDRGKKDDAEEMTYVVTIRRMVNPPPRSPFQM